MAETPPFTPSPTNPTHTGEYCIEEFSDIFDELYANLGPTASMGTMGSLAERLAVAINDDGTLKSSVTANEWLSIGATLARVSNTEFTVAGDYTAYFPIGRRVRFTASAATYTYAFVSTSYASSSITDVTVGLAAVPASANLNAVDVGFGPYSMPDRFYTAGLSAYAILPTFTTSDTLVLATLAQSLTNKTLTSALLTAPGVTLGVFASATMSTPLVYGGTFASATMSAPVAASATCSNTTLDGDTNIASCLFSVFPTTPSTAPANAYDVANKQYVDDSAGGGFLGYIQGCDVNYSSAAGVTMGAGVFDAGGTDITVASTLTIPVSGLTGAGWFFLTFDPDACAGGVASAACFAAVTTASFAYDDTKLGIYRVTVGETNQRAVFPLYASGASTLRAFHSSGNHYRFDLAPADVSTATPATTATLAALTVPSGYRVQVFLGVMFTVDPIGAYLYIWNGDGGAPSTASEAVIASGSHAIQFTGFTTVVTNISGQIYYKCSHDTELYIYTRGFDLPVGVRRC